MTPDTSNPRESGQTPTPWTDSVEAQIIRTYEYSPVFRQGGWVDAGFARELERDLIAAQERVKSVESQREYLRERLNDLLERELDARNKLTAARAELAAKDYSKMTIQQLQMELSKITVELRYRIAGDPTAGITVELKP